MAMPTTLSRETLAEVLRTTFDRFTANDAGAEGGPSAARAGLLEALLAQGLGAEQAAALADHLMDLVTYAARHAGEAHLPPQQLLQRMLDADPMPDEMGLHRPAPHQPAPTEAPVDHPAAPLAAWPVGQAAPPVPAPHLPNLPSVQNVQNLPNLLEAGRPDAPGAAPVPDSTVGSGGAASLAAFHPTPGSGAQPPTGALPQRGFGAGPDHDPAPDLGPARPFGTSVGPEVTGLTGMTRSDGFMPGGAVNAPEVTSLTGDATSPHLGRFIPTEVAVLTVEGSRTNASVDTDGSGPDGGLGQGRNGDDTQGDPSSDPPPSPNLQSQVSIRALRESVIEGGRGDVASVSFVVTRDNPVAQATLDWTASGLSAERFPGGTLPGGTLTFAVGQTEATITVPLAGNDLPQPDADLRVTLQGGGGMFDIDVPQAATRVVDDDSLVSIRATRDSVLEGSTSQVLSFVVSRSNGLSPSRIDWQAGGLDAADLGGPLPQGTLDFAAGELQKTVQITLRGDLVVEPDELLSVTLLNPGPNLQLDPAARTATTTVLNDDAIYAISAEQDVVSEGDAGSTRVLSFTITRTSGVGAGQIDWAASGLDSADLGGASLPSGTAVFADGETRKTVQITLVGDRTVEADETLTVTLLSDDPAQVHPLNHDASTRVLNDDAVFAIQAATASVLEGDSGEVRTLQFTVTRTQGDGAVSVAWVASGVNPSHFGGTLPSGELQFAAGELSKTITLNASGDRLGEVDERLTVTLQPGPNRSFVPGSDSAGTTLVNDDSDVSISAVAGSVAEGDSGQNQTLQFVITRTNGAGTGSVTWQASGLDGTDVGGGLPSGVIDFAPGELSRMVSVPLVGDRTVEADETLQVTITAGANSRVAPSGGTAATVVRNDDMQLTVTTPLPEVPEGDTGQSRVIEFVVGRSNGLGATSVDWQAAGLDPAEFGGTLPSGTLDFADGETSRTVQITVGGDTVIDGDSTLSLVLSNPGPNVQLPTGAQNASVTILDDDGVVGIGAAQPSVLEGDSGSTTTLVFTVTRSNDVSAGQVDWQASGLDSADLGGPLPQGTVSFAAGEATRTIEIVLPGDRSVEADESLVVTLGQPSANLAVEAGHGQAGTVVRNDDALMSVGTATVAVDEGDTGAVRTVDFTISRTAATAATTVDWAVGGLDAADFGGTLPSGTETFAVGELSRVVQVPITGDRAIEPDETLDFVLSNPGPNSVLSQDSASVLVRNDDVGFGLTGLVMDVQEGDTGEQVAVTFRVVRSDSLSQAMSIDYRLFSIGGQGVDVQDWVAGQDSLGSNGGLPSGTVSFAANETEKTVTVHVAGDTFSETDETFGVILVNPPVGAQILYGEAQGVVRTDDLAFNIAAVTASTVEGNGVGGVQQFLVSRTGDLALPTSVGYATAGIGENPADAADFAAAVLPSGVVNFASGQASVLLELPLSGDSQLEGLESYAVSLVAIDPNSAINVGTALARITPDDTEVAIAAVEATRKEGTAQPGGHSFVVTRAGALSEPLTLSWSVQGHGANPVNAADFGGSLPTGTVSFAAGQSQQTITVTPSADAVLEPNEGYAVLLSTAQSGVVLTTPQATGIVLNDDVGVSIVASDLDRAEGNPGLASALSFLVQRSGDLTTDASVDWALQPSAGSSLTAADFAAAALPSGTVAFPRGVASMLVSMPLTTDAVVEADEGFTITLSSPTEGTSITVGEVSGTIRNDDAVLTLVAGTPVAEGHSGGTSVTLTVQRSGDTRVAHTVDYAVAGVAGPDSADAADFAGGAWPSGTLVFAAGEASKTISLTLQGDSVLEADEAFAVTLSNPGAGSTIDQDSTTVTVRNDDDVLALSAVSTGLAEGGVAGQVAHTFTVARSGALDKTTTVAWQVAGHGADPASAADFVGGALPGGTLSFGPGEAAKTITVLVNGDHLLEADEAFTVQLGAAPDGTVISAGSADGTIVNDDTALSIAATTTAMREGDAGQQTHVFTVTRSGILTGSTSVDWSVAGSGAAPVSVGELSPAGGTLVFAPGEVSRTIELQHGGDTAIEPTEGFTVTLANAGTAELRVPAADGSVVNDDIGLSIAANQASAVEGASLATQVLAFTVTRSGDATVATAVDWAASGMAADDFAGGTALSGRVNFAIGETSRTINLTLAGDNTVEPDETLVVTLSNPDAPAQILQASASTAVPNDDAALSVSGPGPLAEGNAGFTDHSFTVTRSGNLDQPASADWRVQLAGGSGSASVTDFIAGQDGLGDNDGRPSGTVSFAAGVTSAEVVVRVSGDQQVELDEAFSLVLQDVSPNNSFVNASALATIANDDTGFSIAAVSASSAEGDSGTQVHQFTVTRAGDLSAAATVDWALAGNAAVAQATGAANAADFDAGQALSGSVSFAAGEASRTLDVLVKGDVALEGDEGYSVTIGNARLADNSPQQIADASADGLIREDDVALVASAANASVSEGTGGTRQVVFDVLRQGDPTVAMTVDYAVTGSNGAAASDLLGGILPTGTLAFAPGVMQLTVTMDVLSDAVAEADEVFTLTISNPSSGSIGTATAQTTVTNDDTNYALAAPADTAEGGSGTTPMVFTVTRSGVLDQAGSVSWRLLADTGLTSADFVGAQDGLGTNGGLPSGTLAFAAGQGSRTITVNVQGDTTLESDETLAIELFEPVVGTLATGASTASAELLTDDDRFDIAAVAPSIAEGSSGGTTNLSFTVTRTGSLDGARDIDWSVSGAGLTAADFTLGVVPSGTLNFADGEASKTLVIGLAADSEEEAAETVTVTLANAPANTTFGTSSASITGSNDDASLGITTLLADKVEGNSGNNPYTFTVSRTGNLSQVTTVEYRVGGGTDATTAADFAGGQDALANGGLPSGTVSFASGESSKTITLNVLGDSARENDETLRVTLTNPSAGASVVTASADGVVRNDDAEYNITSTPANVAEGDAGHGTGVPYTYTVTRSGSLSQTTSVNWSLVHGTTNNSDFTNGVDTFVTPSGTLNFANGVATQSVTVYVHGDTGNGSVENDETFSIALSSPTAGSSLGATSTATSTILNDDTLVTLSVDDMQRAETTAGGSTVYTYTATRSGDTSKVTTLNWSTSGISVYVANDGNWNDGAAASDFSGGVAPSGSLSFASGETLKTFTVTVAGDNTVENDEWFGATLSGGSNYDQLNALHQSADYGNGSLLYNGSFWVANNATTSNFGTVYAEIKRDEGYFEVGDNENTGETGSFSYRYSRPETDTAADGGSDAMVEHVFAVRRTISTSGTAWVNWALSGTVGSYYPSNAADFQAGQDALGTNGGLPSGTLNFADGQSWGYIKVYTTPDNVGELDEAFRVYLTGVSGGSSYDVYDGAGYNTNYGYLTNDDTRFDAVASDTTEGGALTFTITRAGDSRGTDTVDWSLTLPGSETGNESNANTGTWYKLDPADIDSVTPSNGSASFNAGTWSGTMTFEHGETTKTVVVQTVDDALTETWREELAISLSNAMNVDAGEPNNDLETASVGLVDTGWVLDNEPDPLISVTASAASVYEGTGSGNSLTYTITRTDQAGRDGALNYPTTVAWQITGTNLNWGSPQAEVSSWGGNAASVQNGIYSNQTYGLVSFAAGESSKTVVVNFGGDTYVEPDRALTFSVKQASEALYYPWYTDLYGPANIDAAQASVATTLKNDDVRLWLNNWDTSAPYTDALVTSAYEGNPLAFNIVRGGRLDVDVVVGYTLTAGTAGAADFVSTSGNITLPAQVSAYGTTSQSVSLAGLLAQDLAIEGNETFTLRLTAPANQAGSAVSFQSYYLDYNNVYSGAPSATLDIAGTIYDDDTTYTLAVDSASKVETDTGSQQSFVFTVARTSGYTGTASVRWRVEAVGAHPVDSTDFVSSDTLGTNAGLPSGTVSFSNGEASDTFSVVLRGDISAEFSEGFRVVLFEDTITAPSPTITHSLAIASADLTVATDDTGISIADASVTEGDSGTVVASFIVTRSGDLAGATTANWSVLNGSTTADDFGGALSGSLSFAAGESSKTISVSVAGDALPESNETFTVQLSALTGIDEVIRSAATGTVTNDDSGFSIAATDGSGAEDGGAQTFTISRTHDTPQNQTITWQVQAGGAGTADATDFGGALPSGSVTFAPGELTKVVTIDPSTDNTPETDEEYTVAIALGAGTGGDSITVDSATGTIVNDDSAFVLQAGQVSKAEGDAGTTAFTFDIVRTGNSVGAASVDWAVGSAVAVGADFAGGVMPGGTASFVDGQGSITVTVDVATDTVIEADEPFSVTLSNPVNGAILVSSVASTIVNDDSQVSIAPNDASHAEGNSGASTPFTFTVTRTGSLTEAETVEYTVVGAGGAPADATDFGGALPSGTLALPAGASEVTLTVSVSGDLTAEESEGFTVALANPSAGVTIGTATASGLIEADDVVFDIGAPAATAEGDAGTTTMSFVVTRAGNLSGSQTLTWTVAGHGSDPTSADDFAATSGSVVFAAGETSRTIDVQVAGDTRGESDEGYRVTLAGPAGAIFTHASADATIIDDEASLRLSALDAQHLEGQDGDAGVLYTFRVTRSGNTAIEATADWSVTAGAGIDASDFETGTLPSGSVTLAPGVNEQTLQFLVHGDLVVEPDETVGVVLSNASAGADIVQGSAQGLIVSDDTQWSVAVVSTPAVEGDGGSTFTLRVSRSGGLQAMTIDWSTAGSGAHPAAATDFAAGVLPSGTLTFAAGVASMDFTVGIGGDSALEPDEGFTVTLASPSGSYHHVLAVPSVDAQIVDDDDVMSIAATGSAAEGQVDGASVAFTVTRTGSLAGASTVGWQLAHGSTDAADFLATSGTVSFADGEATRTLNVPLAADRVVEADETFTVQLVGPGAGSTVDGSAATGAGTVVDDDVDLAVAALAADLSEGDGAGAGSATFTVTRTGDLDSATTVNWRVHGGDAVAADFAAGQDTLAAWGGMPSGTLAFAAGEASKTVTVALAGDGLHEADETFALRLFDADGNADIVTNDAGGVIRNDDDSLAISAAVADVAEGAPGASTAFSFLIERTGSTTGTSTVDWVATGSGGRPLSADEFVASTGSVVLASGEASKLVTVLVHGDALGEYDEGFSVSLANPGTGSNLVGGAASGIVRNDDPVLVIESDQASAPEGEAGNERTFTFTVTRSGSTAGNSSVLWAVEGSGAHPATVTDFGGAFPSGALGFLPGQTTQTISVIVQGDDIGERSEGFTVRLSDPQGATVLVDSADSVIANDDSGMLITALDASHPEGNSGATTDYTFRIERVGDDSLPASVDWAASGVGVDPATADDFVGGVLPSGSVLFAPGDTVQDIVLQVAGDDTAGDDQTFRVQLSNNVGADIVVGSAQGTIVNDDSEVSVAALQASRLEGDGGTTGFTFTVSRTGAIDHAGEVGWQVVPHGGNAVAAADFVGAALPSGTVLFAAGEASRTVTVQVAGDTTTELDEQFLLQLVNPGPGVSVSPTDSAAVGTVLTDDLGVSLLPLDVDRAEGQSGQTAYSFQVLRAGSTAQSVTLDYTIGGDVDATDFVSPLTGSFTMGVGVSSQVLTLYGRGDAALEPDEAFHVTLSGSGVSVEGTPVAGVMRNDDEGLTVTARTASVPEGSDGETVDLVFDVVRSTTSQSVDAAWQVAGLGASAVDADDFDGGVLPGGTLHFAVGEASTTFTVRVRGDQIVEAAESMLASVSYDSAGRTISGAGSAIVANDDVAGPGNDVMFGGSGSDTLSGLGGDDWLDGGAGSDVLSGADGNDTLVGGAGGDVLNGGAGADRFYYTSPSQGLDVIQDFEAGVDQLDFLPAGFGGIGAGGAVPTLVTQAFDTDVATTLGQLAAQADVDVYRVSFNAGQFGFSAGAGGHLDELESAITDGAHTGPAFFLVSDGSLTRLYYDADTNAGHSGAGLLSLAELQSLPDAGALPVDLPTPHGMVP